MIKWEHVITPCLVTGAGLMLLFAARAFSLRVLRARPVLAHSLRVPSFFWCLAGTLLVALTVFPLPEKIADQSHLLVQILLILSVTAVISDISVMLVRDALNKAGGVITGSGLVFGVIRSTVFSLGLLVILSKFGISIAPIVTALGVGGVAAGLALKDTLENLISGIHILIDGDLHVGDRITLDTNQEGIIEDIGWRTCKLRLQDEDILLIPNTKLAQGIVLRRQQRQGA